MTGREKLIQMLENDGEEFANAMGEGIGCPNTMGLRERCDEEEEGKCSNCWRLALQDKISE